MVRTLARAHLRPGALDSCLHFYVVHPTVENVARDILLMEILQNTEMHPADRCELFLDVFGNVLVRGKTEEYLAQKKRDLIRWFIDGKGNAFSEHFDLDLLKFKEKDLLEEVFRSWDPSVEAPVSEMRDYRLRSLFKDRYDHRDNLADWDYNMRLMDLAPIIHIKHFCSWRRDGVAFPFRQATYTQPNRSLLTLAPQQMEQALRPHRGLLNRGLYGDVIIGPYIPFGVHSEHSSLFAQSNRQHVKTAVDVSFLNLLTYIREAEDAVPYELSEEEAAPFQSVADAGANLEEEEEPVVQAHPSSVAEASGSGEKIVEVPVEREEAAETGGSSHGDPGKEGIPAENYTSWKVPYRVHFMVGDPSVLQSAGAGGKFQGLFDTLYVSNLALAKTSADLRPLLAEGDHVRVVQEACKFLLPLKPEQKSEFLRRCIDTHATNLGRSPVACVECDSAGSFVEHPIPDPATPTADFVIFR